MKGYRSFAGYYDILTQNIPYQTRGEYFNALFQRHGGKTGILLDLACGTGSLSEVMDGLGWDVIGVDGSSDMLMEAMAKKARSGKDILYLCQDMRDLDLYGTVDGCICALDSLNHVGQPKDVQRIFDRVALFLAPGGLFLFDVNTRYKHEQILSGRTFVYDMDEVFCVWQNSACKNGAVQISLDFFGLQEDGSYLRECDRFSERAYSDRQIRSFLRRAGLEYLASYGDDSFSPPSETTQRVIYVARSMKPQEEESSWENSSGPSPKTAL